MERNPDSSTGAVHGEPAELRCFSKVQHVQTVSVCLQVPTRTQNLRFPSESRGKDIIPALFASHPCILLL